MTQLTLTTTACVTQIENCLSALPAIFTSRDILSHNNWDSKYLPIVSMAIRRLQQRQRVELLGRKKGGAHNCFLWKTYGSDVSENIDDTQNGLHRTTTLNTVNAEDSQATRIESVGDSSGKSIKYYFGNDRRAICTVKKAVNAQPKIWWDFGATDNVGLAESCLTIIEEGLEQMKEWGNEKE